MYRVAIAFLLALPTVAAARRAGVTGYSGASGQTCAHCHSGGARPSVHLDGPTHLLPGQQATFTLTLSGGAAVVGGLDVATDVPDAVLATVTADTQLVDGEITHLHPLAFAAGTLTTQFAVTAPSRCGNFTIYAAANSCDGDRTTHGDLPATTTATIFVSPDTDGGPPSAADCQSSATPPPTDDPPPPTGCTVAAHPRPSATPIAAAVLFLALALRRIVREG